MLSSIKDIGALVIEREGKELFDILVEDPNTNGSYKKVIAIIFEQKGDKIKFKSAELEDYDSEKKMRYLYRAGAANGSDLSPTAKLSGKPEGTFDRKILGWFRITETQDLNISDQDKNWLKAVAGELKENSTDIKNEILRLRDITPKKESILLTLKVQNHDGDKYVGDFPVFRELLRHLVNQKDSRLTAKDQVCAICGEKKPEIFGNIDTYAFYTLDKPGYITGGFDTSRAWRNFPVCSDCKIALEEGKKFVEANLAFRFCGIRYNLVPKFIAGVKGVSEEVLDIFTNTSRVVSLRQQVMDVIANDEEEILDELKDLEDIITLNFLFIQRMNAAERILLLIEDVFPSRIRNIFEAKYRADLLFDDSFTFRNIRSFFSKSDANKRNYDLDGYFLDIIDRVFKGRPISLSFLLKFIMKKVRDEFINDGYFRHAVKDGLMTIAFLEGLKMIKMGEEAMEDRTFDELFKKYGPMFETPLKRGLFLLGSLAELLLRKQYTEREAKPFTKNLKSLKMTERDFKGLLPKVQNKLDEYDSFDKGKRLLAKEASNYLLLAGDNWTMPTDELNFYFAAGMNLTDEIAEIIYPGKDKNEVLNEND